MNIFQLVTVIYCIGGIPLFFLCMGHIGETLSSTFRFLYWRVFYAMCSNRKKVDIVERNIAFIAWLFGLLGQKKM